MRSSRKLLALSACAALASSACFAVTDLDRFEKRGQSVSNFTDLRLTVRGMTSHVNELFEYRVVDATNTIQSRGFIVPLGGVEASVFVPGAIPRQNGPFRLDFYSDHDLSGGHDTSSDARGDHSWRVALDPAATDDRGVVNVVFDHNTSFTYLNEPGGAPSEVGKPATIRMTKMGLFLGRRVQVRVADASSRRVVALYRIPALGGPDVAVSVPGMIEPGVIYAVEVTVDGGNQPLRAFRVEQTSNPTGLDVAFDPTSAAEVNDAPPP